VKNPSIATRRDSGLIAALCAAPARGTPRKWPANSLKIEGREVLRGTQQLRNHASLFPYAFGMPGESDWPGRTNGGSTANLQWSQSRLLFPGPNGAPLSRAALHNALRRLNAGRRAQQHRAHHSGKDQSRFPLEGSFGNPKVVLPMNAIQCNSSGMNATILMRIMPDLRSKYAIRVDGETVGNLETLDEALLALERLRDRDFTVEQARKMLDVSVP
jgi:hypothetical protein